MLAAILVVTTLAGYLPHGDLMALDREIAALQRQREGMKTFADLSRRDEVDRQLAMLGRVRGRAIEMIDARIRHCHLRVPLVVGGPAPTQGQVAVACMSAADGVVATVRRIEELRVAAEGKRTWDDRNRREALLAEAEALENGLLEP